MTATYIFRISEAGKCPRVLWADRNNVKGEPIPAFLSGAAEEGNLHEPAIKDKLRKLGYEIEEAGICTECQNERKGIHVEYRSENIMFVGHMDGKAVKDKKLSVLECKSMSQFEFDRWMKGRFGEFPEYAAQATLYMLGSDIDRLLYAVKNRSSGYLDKMEITGEPADIDNILSSVKLAIKKDMPDIEPNWKSLRCKRCRYKKLCVKTKEDMVIRNEAELDMACEMWRDGNKEIKSGDNKVSAAKAVFMEHAIAAHLKNYTYNELGIVFIEREGNISYDKEMLKQLLTPTQLKTAEKKGKDSKYITVEDLRE